MIETHMMNATLNSDLRASAVFDWLTFINGLVAPAFTFASGLAYAVATRRKINDYLALGKPLMLNIRRLLFIIMIGYLLHIPKFNFHQLLNETTEQSWQAFFQADVLQCIGVSLLIVQALLLLVRTERRLYTLLLILSVAIAFVSPIVWSIDWRRLLPLPIAGYMNGMHFRTFSGFPLFPWAAFILAGAVVGYHFIEAKQRNAEQRFFNVMLWVGLSLMIFSALIEPVASRLYPVYDYGRFSPSFFFLRLGIVILLCTVLFFYERRFSVSPQSLITLAGRESLIVYTVHLFLLYGDLGTFNFARTVQGTFGYGEAVVATLVLAGLMIVLAFVWDRLRKTNPHAKQSLHWAIAAAFVLVFFFGPENR